MNGSVRPGPARPTLRQALADPATRLVGTFVMIPRLEIVEALAYTGFDAIVLDLEHAPVAARALPELVAAGQGAGAYVLARLGDRTPAVIGKALDAGVDGVMLPHVGGTVEAAEAVDSVRYPPEGSRSLNPYVRAARYAADASYTSRANSRQAVVVMVEGEDGVEAAGDIAAVPGIDAVFVGPVDLSAALGLVGQPEHPLVVERIRDLIQRMARAGVGVGIYCPTPQAADRWRRAGVRLAAVSADIAMAMSGFRSYLEPLHRRRREELIGR